jgi:hypothetical protein
LLDKKNLNKNALSENISTHGAPIACMPYCMHSPNDDELCIFSLSEFLLLCNFQWLEYTSILVGLKRNQNFQTKSCINIAIFYSRFLKASNNFHPDKYISLLYLIKESPLCVENSVLNSAYEMVKEEVMTPRTLIQRTLGDLNYPSINIRPKRYKCEHWNSNLQMINLCFKDVN